MPGWGEFGRSSSCCSSRVRIASRHSIHYSLRSNRCHAHPEREEVRPSVISLGSGFSSPVSCETSIHSMSLDFRKDKEHIEKLIGDGNTGGMEEAAVDTAGWVFLVQGFNYVESANWSIVWGYLMTSHLRFILFSAQLATVIVQDESRSGKQFPSPPCPVDQSVILNHQDAQTQIGKALSVSSESVQVNKHCKYF